MPNQPGKTQNHFEVAQLHDVAGEGLGVHPMDAQARSEVVGDRTGRGDAAVAELNGDGLSVWGGVQVILNQDGGVEETVGCARVDKGLDGDGSLTWY